MVVPMKNQRCSATNDKASRERDIGCRDRSTLHCADWCAPVFASDAKKNFS